LVSLIMNRLSNLELKSQVSGALDWAVASSLELRRLTLS
jgi:hypothetical protein